jgi:hypothetical protein
MKENGQVYAHAALAPGNKLLLSIVYENGWASEPVLDAVKKRKISYPF